LRVIDEHRFSWSSLTYTQYKCHSGLGYIGIAFFSQAILFSQALPAHGNSLTGGREEKKGNWKLVFDFQLLNHPTKETVI